MASWEDAPIINPAAANVVANPATSLAPWEAAPEVQSDGPAGYAATFGDGAATGVPIVGGYLNSGINRYIAGLQSVVNGSSYADELAALETKQQGLNERHPRVHLGGEIAGGIAGTAPAMMAAPAAFGVGGGSLIARSAASAATGAAIGGADQAVRTEGDPMATAQGAGVGAMFGGAGPGVGRLLGNGASRIAGYFDRPDNALTGIPRAAVRYAQETVLDPARQAAVQGDLARLGPQAMLADASPEWLGVARAAASRPGTRDAIVSPLLERDAAKNVRLGADLDRSLGRAVVPSQVEAQIGANRAALGPQYETALGNASPVDNSGLAARLEAMAGDLRGPARTAAVDVRNLLNRPGTNELDQSPRALLETRKAIDGMTSGTQDRNVLRILRDARAEVDGELAASVPGIKDVDAQFAEYARQSDALERGGMVLDAGKTAIRPVELRDELMANAVPQGRQIGPSAVPLRMQQGARAELDRIAGTSANDPAALTRAVRAEGDWNRDKLRTLYGPDRADQALGAIDREATFMRTGGRVTAGSDTALTNRFGDFLDEAAKPRQIPTDTTMTGLTLRALQKAVGAASEASAQAKSERFADALGELSVARGSARDDIVRALAESVSRRRGAETMSSNMREIVNLLIRSSGPSALLEYRR